MTHARAQIAYGDNFRIQPQLSKVVDLAVVKFINAHNGEHDLKKGFDDPMWHLPDPTDPRSGKMRAYRRWHGVDWWMIVYDGAIKPPAIGEVTKRVTIMPDDIEPDTLILTPDLIVTRGGVRFTLPVQKLRYKELKLDLFEIYRRMLLESNGREFADKSIADALSRAWEFVSMFDPSDATEAIP